MRNELAKPVAYASRIRCVWTIPFGSPVVPELYRIVSGWSSGRLGDGGGVDERRGGERLELPAGETRRT